MFRFRGRLTRSPFLIGAVIRVVLFAATVFGFPFILWGVALATGCRAVGGACGAVALVASMVLKPVFFLVFVYSLIGISLRRARDTGLPGWFGFAIPLLVLCDLPFGLFGGAHWSFAFTMGALTIPPPWFMLAALVLIAGLAALPSRDDATPRSGALAWIGELPPAPGWLPLIGALLAAGAVMATQPPMLTAMGFLVLAPHFVPVWFPTFVIYTALLYGVWCIVNRRDTLTMSVTAVTAVPFVIWAATAALVPLQHGREAADIQAIKTEKLVRAPDVLVFQSSTETGLMGLLGLHGIKEIIADGPYARTTGMMSYTGKRKPNGSVDLAKVENLPDEYLLLKVGRKSSFFGNTAYIDGGPLELRHIAPGRDDLIAVWYRSYNVAPTFPPVLTFYGWRRPFAYTPADVIAANIRGFVNRSISDARVPPQNAALDPRR